MRYQISATGYDKKEYKIEMAKTKSLCFAVTVFKMVVDKATIDRKEQNKSEAILSVSLIDEKNSVLESVFFDQNDHTISHFTRVIDLTTIPKEYHHLFVKQLKTTE